MPIKDPVHRKRVQCEYARRHYKKNKALYLARGRRVRAAKLQYLKGLKQKARCKDCNKLYPEYVLEFDHARGKKLLPMPRMVNYGWQRLFTELRKCDIVCANCHCIRTYTRKSKLEG